MKFEKRLKPGEFLGYKEVLGVAGKIVNTLNGCYEHKKVCKELKKEVELCDLLLETLFLAYDSAMEIGNNQEQVKICRIVIKVLLPRYLRFADAYENEDEIERARIFDQYKRAYALSARRSMYHFAKYIEWESSKKLWNKTANTMAVAFKYADRLIAEKDMLFYRLSCQPGLGKTYLVNLIVANMFGNDKDMTIIRVSYAEDNVKSSTSQIKTIMSMPAYREVFPWFQGFGDLNTQYEFKLNGSIEAVNYVGVTRFGQLSGKRGKVMIYDDILKGEMEAGNKALCDQVTQVIIGDAESRADDDKQKTITVGTIRSVFDPMLKQVNNVSTDWKTTKDKYCEVALNEVGEISAVSIAIPALDYETDESTCPQRYSTKYLRKQRQKLGDSFFALYQQTPKPIEGLGFGYNNLVLYDKLPDKKPLFVCAYADTPRTGKNYFSMPIFYNYGEEQWFLADCIFKKRQSKELIERILEKINTHKINQFCLENNVDTTLDSYITQCMKERGGWQCVVFSEYSYLKKEVKIMTAAPNIKRYLVFPRKESIYNNHELVEFMEQLTSYSFEYPNKYDDAADSVSMFLNKFVSIEGTDSPGGEIKPIDIKKFGGRI